MITKLLNNFGFYSQKQADEIIKKNLQEIEVDIQSFVNNVPFQSGVLFVKSAETVTIDLPPRAILLLGNNSRIIVKCPINSNDIFAAPWAKNNTVVLEAGDIS